MSGKDINAMYLLDMPVFSINEAEAIGVVKNIILDPVEKCLLALAVDKRGWYHDVRVVPAGKIRSIGEDVINIDEKGSASRAVNLPRIVEYMHNPYGLVGNRIISDAGHALGKVERYYLDRESGRISRLDIAGGLISSMFTGRISIPAQYIITIGTAAVVVDRACLDDLQITASVLRVNFQTARERAAGVWQQAVDGSQRLGRDMAQQWQQKRQELEQKRLERRQLREGRLDDTLAEELPVNL